MGDDIYDDKEIAGVNRKGRVREGRGIIDIPKDQNLRSSNINKRRLISDVNCKFYKLINNIIITEKSIFLSNNGLFTFSVTPLATKSNIIGFIEKLFGIGVVSVRIINCGKIVSKWKNKKKVNKKVEKEKKAIVRFIDGIDIDMSRMKEMFDKKVMEG